MCIYACLSLNNLVKKGFSKHLLPLLTIEQFLEPINKITSNQLFLLTKLISTSCAKLLSEIHHIACKTDWLPTQYFTYFPVNIKHVNFYRTNIKLGSINNVS